MHGVKCRRGSHSALGAHVRPLLIHLTLSPHQVRESTGAAFLVVNAAFFTGLFTFAIFLGIVSDEVKSTFRWGTSAMEDCAGLCN